MNTQLIPLDKIFDKQWLSLRKELQYPLEKNQNYRVEVNNWLQFFDKKGWLDQKLIKRLRNARTWTSYYSKINELRAGYFFKEKLNFSISGYEAPTHDNKNVEFKGRVKSVDMFIEVKTPLDLDRKLYKGGWFNNNNKIYEVLDKAAEQLPDNASTIVVLSDDLNLPLLLDPLAQNSIWIIFNSTDYEKISAICILGNIFHEDMYKMLWATNSNAKKLIDEGIFSGFNKLHQLL